MARRRAGPRSASRFSARRLRNTALFDAVKAVGMELCPTLDISIPVGKDSLSMRTTWQAPNQAGLVETHSVTAPLSLVATAFAPVTDVRRVLTPEIPAEMIEATSKVYIQAFEAITGQTFEPPSTDEAVLDRIRRNLAPYRP